MKLLVLVFQLVVFSAMAAAAAPVYSKPGCPDKCGTVTIPYPFGIYSPGRNCYPEEWYAVSCNSSDSGSLRPFLRAFNEEILNVSLTDRTVTINSSVGTSDCARDGTTNLVWSSRDLSGTPFLFSREHNKFTAVGCGNAFVLEPGGDVITGCSAICNTSVSQLSSSNNICYGINCCEARLPYYVRNFSVDMTGLARRQPSPAGGDCGGAAAFFGEETYLDHARGDGFGRLESSSFVPVALLWTLPTYYAPRCPPRILDVSNDASIITADCNCGIVEEGNPFISGGCQIVEVCAGCEECQFSDGNFTCIGRRISSPRTRSRSSATAVILGVSISIGVLLLVAGSFLLYKAVQKTKDKRRKSRFFKRNGGLLLQQQVSADEGLVEKTKLFTARELEKATDNFNENRILGRGGQGTVYKGMLTDGRIVAVKKSKLVDESQLEQFINEVVILSQINHRNVVKLLGCCLETDVPLLVYEHISNGTLYEHIHNETDEFPLSWNMRLQIAKEVAGALAYLHSAASIPIYHRDIKSTNILLDDKHRAKVSDFGTSRSVAIDQTHLTTLVKGTFGYLDPEYFQSSQFTEKSDVYSFGVVLVELLTGQRPISSTRTGEQRSLATHFILSLEEGKLFQILDPRVLKEGAEGELVAVANLANRCLNLNGKKRPTMKEVAAELEAIKMFQMSSSSSTLLETDHFREVHAWQSWS